MSLMRFARTGLVLLTLVSLTLGGPAFVAAQSTDGRLIISVRDENDAVIAGAQVVVLNTGTQQEMGPLNPYARRLVHLTVAEDPEMSSESIGDAFMKTVIISVRR